MNHVAYYLSKLVPNKISVKWCSVRGSIVVTAIEKSTRDRDVEYELFLVPKNDNKEVYVTYYGKRGIDTQVCKSTFDFMKFLEDKQVISSSCHSCFRYSEEVEPTKVSRKEEELFNTVLTTLLSLDIAITAFSKEFGTITFYMKDTEVEGFIANEGKEVWFEIREIGEYFGLGMNELLIDKIHNKKELTFYIRHKTGEIVDYYYFKDCNLVFNRQTKRFLTKSELDKIPKDDKLIETIDKLESGVFVEYELDLFKTERDIYPNMEIDKLIKQVNKKLDDERKDDNE